MISHYLCSLRVLCVSVVRNGAEMFTMERERRGGPESLSRLIRPRDELRHFLHDSAGHFLLRQVTTVLKDH